MTQGLSIDVRSLPEIYEQVLVPALFTPFAEHLLDRLSPPRADSLLDVACGTGIVARLARRRLDPGALVVGVDLSPAMLSVARRTDPSIDWREGAATALPVGDGQSFSLVTCHQGLQFFADRPAAAREMRRVLAPGGRLAVACWGTLAENRATRELNEIVERHVGPIADARHGFGDSAALRAVLSDAGFEQVRVESYARDVRFADGALFATLNAMAAIGMTEAGRTSSDAERRQLAEQVAAESADVIGRYTNDGRFVMPLTTSVALARGQPRRRRSRPCARS